MARGGDSLKVRRAGTWQQVDPHIEDASNCPDRSKRHRVGAAALEPGDPGVRHAAGEGKLPLRQPALHTSGPNGDAKPLVVHDRHRGGHRVSAG
jgi:hypothetical protein